MLKAHGIIEEQPNYLDFTFSRAHPLGHSNAAELLVTRPDGTEVWLLDQGEVLPTAAYRGVVIPTSMRVSATGCCVRPVLCAVQDPQTI